DTTPKFATSKNNRVQKRKMQLTPECLVALKYSEFWENSENPSLLSFFEYRLHNNLEQKEKEHSRAAAAKKVPGKCISFSSIPLFDTHHDYPAGCVLVAGKRQKVKRGKSVLGTASKKKKSYKRVQNEIRGQICIEQSQLVLDTAKETRSQYVILQKTVTKRRLLNELSEKTYNEDDRYDKKTKLCNEGDGNEGYDEKHILSEIQEIIEDEENNPFLAPKDDVDNSDYNYDYNVEDSDYNNDVLLTKALQSMNDGEKLIRDALLKILQYNKDKEIRSGKNFMNSLFLNGIIEMANVKEQILIKFEGEQLYWLGDILNKKTWKKTREFINFCNQFNEDNCDRVNVSVLVRKSFVPEGKFNSFSAEGHDIAQDIMKHLLEAPMIRDSRFDDLERTYAIDTIVYIFNRLFRMHQDVLEWRWFDGIIKIPKIKNGDKYIMIIEFSKGRKATEDKEMDDKIKLGRE
ncbi:20012_t:CDS:10, partial [Gigaspora rosea]